MAAPRTLVRWGLLAGRKGGRAASSRGCGENRFHRPGLRSSGLPPASLEGYGIWWLGLLARVCSQELRGQSSAPEEEGVRGRALCPAHLPHPSRSRAPRVGLPLLAADLLQAGGPGPEAVFIPFPRSTGSALSPDRLVYLVCSWGSTWKKGCRLVRAEARVVCGPWPVARGRVHEMSRGHSGVALAGSWGFSERSPDLPVVVQSVSPHRVVTVD